MSAGRRAAKPATGPATQNDLHAHHTRFIRDAIARSLLTLPFAHLDADDPFGTLYGYYKQLMAAAEAGALPSITTVTAIVELIREDATIHESAGNYLKADIERRWSEGLWVHFTREHDQQELGR